MTQKLPERRLMLPVWLLLILGVVAVVLHLLSAPWTPWTLTSSLALAGPPLLAAALLFAMPGPRLIRLAAFGLAVATVVDLVAVYFSGPGYLLPGWVSATDYAVLANRVLVLTDVLADLTWILVLAAVVCLAVYLGGVHTRLGRWIVAAGIGLALLQAAVTLSNIVGIEGATVEPFLAGIISNLSIVGWAYLLASAMERRMVLTSLAAGAFLALTLLSLLSFGVTTLLGSGPTDFVSSVFGGAIYLWLPVAGWGLLILSALLELPRHAKELNAVVQ